MSKPLAKDLVVKTFDYKDIDPEVKGKLIWLAGEGARQTSSHIKSAIALGEVITQAHELLAGNGREGQFGSWLLLELNISRSTATNYMRAYDKFNKFTSLTNFSAEAVYALSGPDVPPAALKEAEKKAGKGVRINIKVAKEIVDRFRIVHKAADTNGFAEPSKPPKEPAAKPAEPAPPAEEAVTDFDPAAIESQPANGVDIPGLSSPYKRAVTDINRILRDFDDLVSEERTGVHLADKYTRIKTDLTAAKAAIYQAEPIQACEKCDGKGCKTCYHSGFWTRAIVGSRKS